MEEAKEWLRQITRSLYATMDSYANTSEQIEVELKYATASIHQSYQSLETILRQLSYQSVIIVNELMKYSYKAGFPDAKKFYALRELLTSLATQNASKATGGRAFNFYRNLAGRYQNGKLALKDSDLRLDINDCGTRSTYSFRRGWEVISKKRLNNFDLMYCNQTVRLSVSTEKKHWDLENLPKALKAIVERMAAQADQGYADKKEVPCLRLKNIAKVEKNEHLEIALSEILEIDPGKLATIADISDELQSLDSFLVNEFANFYTYPFDGSKTFEVECEITSAGLDLLRSFYAEGRRGDFENFLERMLQDFCSLYHSDYCIKKEEAAVIAEKYRDANNGDLPKIVGGRLENLVGNYMRNELLDFMSQP